MASGFLLSLLVMPCLHDVCVCVCVYVVFFFFYWRALNVKGGLLVLLRLYIRLADVRKKKKVM